MALWSRFRSARQCEPVDEVEWRLALELQHQWSERRLLSRRDDGDDTHQGSLSVEENPQPVALHALQEESTRSVSDVPVPELVVHLLKTADL